MSNTIDQQSDLQFRQLREFRELNLLPVWVKQASPEDLTGNPDHPESFADDQGRQFWCQTKEATYVSYCYFLANRDQLHEKRAADIEERLNTFAEYWGIVNSVKALKEKWAELHSPSAVETPDSDYAIVRVGDDGQKIRQYPVRNAAEVKQAAAWLHESRDKLPWDLKQAIATKILDKAAELNCSLHPHQIYLQKQAGQGFTSPASLHTAIARRILEVKQAEVEPNDWAGMKKLADSVSRLPDMAVDQDLLCGVAKTLEQFDRAYGLMSKYAENYPRPEEVFSLALKEAQDARRELCQLSNGSLYLVSQLKGVKRADLEGIFGDEFTKEATVGLFLDGDKLGQLLAALPPQDADLFDKVAAANGVKPHISSQQSHRTYSPQELAASLS